MKYKLLLTLGVAAMAFAGCTADIEVIAPQPTPDAPVAINVGGYIDQVTATRVNDDGFCAGDGIGVFVVNNVDGASGTLLNDGNQADNVRFVLNEEESKWNSDYPIYYYDKVTPVDMIGYYPYNANLDDVNNYLFEVQQDQSTTNDTSLIGGYEASDFLWGMTESISPTAERVNIAFRHRMAGVQVELTEGNGWSDGEWDSVAKHTLIANTIRKSSIDLATGVVTPVGEIEIMDIVPAESGNGWRAIVVPQSVDAGMALLRITVDGTTYLFRKNEAFEYQAGKLHKFSIKVTKRESSGLEFNLVSEDITPWENETISHDGSAREYILINVPAATNSKSALEAAIKKTGKDPDRIVNMKVTGRLNTYDFQYMREKMLSLTNLNLEEVVLCDTYGNENNYLPRSAFSNTKKFLRIILPNSTKGIDDYAFYYAKNIVYMDLPESVITIGVDAFNSCSIQYSLTMPPKLEKILQSAFKEASVKFKNFYIPNTLRIIGQSAFENIQEPINADIVFPDGLEEIGPRAFYNSKLKAGDLKIPNKVKEIGASAFDKCKFTGHLILPDGLISIGDNAFYNCGFSGELIIPESVVRIGKSAFEGCSFSHIPVLPKNIQQVGDNAFKFTYKVNDVADGGILEFPEGLTEINLSSYPQNASKIIFHSGVTKITGTTSGKYLREVVCKAKVPPTLSANSFQNTLGINAANKIELVKIEVPEESLYKYQTAQYWKNYIPSVYRDFNLDLESTCALNAQHSRKMIVRAPAEMEWSVSYKPDWVTVTPASGVGKVEVTISFDDMARGNGNRTDSLVFKPTAYDYHKSVKVDQYDYPYDNGDVITNQSATVGNGVNIVFMGDCFDAKDIVEGYYEEIMNEAIEHFFAVEPYKTYRDYFNVYTVVCHSTDSGLPTTHTINKETLFESQYAFADGGKFQFRINEGKCFEYACKAPTVTKDNLCQTPVVVIENSNAYGGITMWWTDNTSLAVQCIHRDEYPFDFRGVIQHEVGGHAFGKLVDEYMYHGDFVDQCKCTCCEHDKELLKRQSYGWAKNLSLNSSHYDVPWSHMIFDPQYSSYVEMYEGGFFHQRGVYRSEPNSCMNNNVPYYSAISRQAIVERIMEYAGEEFTFEKFKAKDSDEIGPIPMSVSMTRSSVATKEESYNPMHNEPVIMGEKPTLNF
ncbi:MAG: leucine-rich repeat protein [Alistipes sp.]|nr:leucine-rich repeat protein [Alistipes sp.]